VGLGWYSAFLPPISRSLELDDTKWKIPIKSSRWSLGMLGLCKLTVRIAVRHSANLQPNIKIQKAGYTNASMLWLHPASDLDHSDGMDLSRITHCIVSRVAYSTTSLHGIMRSSFPEVCGNASDHIIGPGQGKYHQAELSDCRGFKLRHTA
jgi:hypothetical protein